MTAFRDIVNITKKHLVETFQLLWKFKWYILFYIPWVLISLVEMMDPPAVDDPILNYEYTHGAWNYINQEVYIASMKLHFVIGCLVFFIGTSNMRNHPLLARLIFLSPWICMLVGMVVIICSWLISLF